MRTGTLHAHYYCVNGEVLRGNRYDLAAYAEDSYPQEGPSKGQLSEGFFHESRSYERREHTCSCLQPIPKCWYAGKLTQQLCRSLVVPVRTTVTLDDDIYEAALFKAKATGRSLGFVLSEMARHALRSDKRLLRDAEKGSRFPSFDVPPNTPQISASRVQKALDEHGIV